MHGEPDRGDLRGMRTLYLLRDVRQQAGRIAVPAPRVPYHGRARGAALYRVETQQGGGVECEVHALPMTSFPPSLAHQCSAHVSLSRLPILFSLLPSTRRPSSSVLRCGWFAGLCVLYVARCCFFFFLSCSWWDCLVGVCHR